MRIYGYARVSTKDQNLDLQLEKIREYAKIRSFDLIQMYAEKASGKDIAGREAFSEMLATLKMNPLAIEAVVVYKLDRLGRSMSDLIKITELLKEYNIQFISITDNIDTTSSQGRLFFHLMGSLAEFERELIHERTMAGILKAREDGKKFGRKRKVIDMEDIKKQLASGIPKTRVCKNFKCSVSYLNKRLQEERERKK